MKNILLSFFIVATSISYGQFGVNYHQTNKSFVGFNYEIKSRVKPEVRLSRGYQDLISLETILTVDFVNKDDYEFYTGFGVRNVFFQPDLLIPVGFNFYPLDTKKFGFHIELAPMFGNNGSDFRTSFGIRYRFLK